MTHLSGRDAEGENILYYVRPLYDFLEKNQPSGVASCKEKEKVDNQIMARQHPLDANVNESPP